MGRPIWLDGRLTAEADARANVLCHSLQRGSLVFDVGALRDAPANPPVLFRPREHVERFLRSAELIGLLVDGDVESLLAATVETARASGLRTALVRWSAFVATPEPDVVPRPTSRASIAIAVIAPEDHAAMGTGPSRPPVVRVRIPTDARKAGPEVFPPQAKVAASYLGPMLAKRRALADGFDEVVLLDGAGRVAEAPTANVFAVVDGGLVTPPLDRVLAGITRDAVLAIARAEGIPAAERHVAPAELAGADEAFLTATSLPVHPIASVDGQALRRGAPGPVTQQIRHILQACERGEDARFASWALPVSRVRDS